MNGKVNQRGHRQEQKQEGTKKFDEQTPCLWTPCPCVFHSGIFFCRLVMTIASQFARKLGEKLQVIFLNIVLNKVLETIVVILFFSWLRFLVP